MESEFTGKKQCYYCRIIKIIRMVKNDEDILIIEYFIHLSSETEESQNTTNKLLIFWGFLSL